MSAAYEPPRGEGSETSPAPPVANDAGDTRPPDPGGPPSLARRLVDVFVSPGRLFETLRERPVWVSALVLGGALVVASALVVPTELYEEMMREQLQGSSQDLPEGFEMSGTFPKIFGAVGGFVWWMVFAALVSGVVTLVFGFVLGDEGRFKQYLSVTTHALLIMAVGSLLVTPLRIMAGDLQMSFSLGTFAVFVEEGTFLRTLLNALDLFMLWAFAVLGLGVSKLDPDRGWVGPTAFLWGVAVAVAAVFAAVTSGI